MHLSDPSQGCMVLLRGVWCMRARQRYASNAGQGQLQFMRMAMESVLHGCAGVSASIPCPS